jgi:Xaa-Pro aminopeptidase
MTLVRLARRVAVESLAAFALCSTSALHVHAQRAETFAAWTHPTFATGEYVARRARALSLMGRDELMLVPSGEGTSGGETFRQLDDFEYLAALEVPRSVLIIDGRSRRSMLFTPRTDPRFDNRGRPNDFPGRALATDPVLRTLSGVDTVLADDVLDEFLAGIDTLNTRLLINAGRSGADVAPVASAFAEQTAGVKLAATLRRTHPGLAIRNGYALIAALRMIKSPAEIVAMRTSADITARAIALGASRVKAGVDERTLTGVFTADCMALGAQRDAFTPIIKSGSNSLWPWRILGAHYNRRNRRVQSGELVIFDVGCERDHYVSDVGRTFPVSGRFTPRQRNLVEMVRHISDAVIAAAKPGITLADLQRVAVAAIPPAARPYMQAPLYFGHHIGLDAGDPFLPDAPLMPGMIFTIEPWYYNHDEEVAVFIEDEILITADGCENLTRALPRDATGLERLRAGR